MILDFIKEFSLSSSRFLNIFPIAILRSLSCTSAILHSSGPAVVGLLSSSGDILSSMLMIVYCTAVQESGYEILGVGI